MPKTQIFLLFSALILFEVMLPFITVFSRSIPMYGVAVAVGLLFTLLYMRLTERKFGDLARHGELLLVFGLLGAFAGAKILYLIINLKGLVSEFEYLFSKTSAFLKKYVLGGFVFYGGLYGAFAAVFLYARREGLSVSRVFQYMLPVFPLVHGFGRIGCFLMGCCYGRAAESAISVVFENSPVAPNGMPLVPVQLIEAGVEFLLFALLVIFQRKTTGKNMCLLYLGVYSVVRFVLEFFRGDEYRGSVGALSTSQFIALVTISGVVIFSIITRRTHRRA